MSSSLTATTGDALEFPNTPSGQRSEAMTVQVCNGGEAETGPLAVGLSGPEASGFALLPGGCGASVLAGGDCCTATVAYAPTKAGAPSAELTFAADPGGTLRVALSGRTGYRLTVDLTHESRGGGRVESDPPGIDCPGACSAYFESPTVSVVATPVNGSGVVFRGFDEDKCSVHADGSCQIYLSNDITVGVPFADVFHNLVFFSSEAFPANLGSVEAYDAACNRLATAAGINNVSGSAFVAWIADGRSSPVTRLGTARGFERVDGAPFADEVASLLGGKMFTVLGVTERGVHVGERMDAEFWTGLFSNGDVFESQDGSLVSHDCDGWSNAQSGFALIGDAEAGPGVWSDAGLGACNDSRAIACFMRTMNAPLRPPSPPTGTKKIFVSNSALRVGGGWGSANRLCDQSKPIGVTGEVHPLLSTTFAAASTVVSVSATYARVDGQIVGTGAELISGGKLRSGIWQAGDGTYLLGNLERRPQADDTPFVWTGSASPGDGGTRESLCENLLNSMQVPAPTLGWYGTTHEGTWWKKASASARCDLSYRVYCVEQ